MGLDFPRVQQASEVSSSKEENVTGKYYKTYYPCKITSGASMLIPTPRDADTAYTQYSKSNGTISGAINFDLTIDRHTEIGGRMFISTSLRQTVIDANDLAWVRFYAKHVNVSGAETQIGVEQTPNLAGGDYAYRYLIGVDIPKTRFNPDEKFRLTAEYWGYGTGAGMTGRLYHDPTSRLSTVVGDGVHDNHATSLIVDLPFTGQAET